MPIDGRHSRYARWVGDEDFDVERVAEAWRVIPGQAIDFANKLLKPVSNFWTTYRRLAQGIANGTFSRESYQPMAKWVADNPPFPGRAWAQWIRMMYRDDALARGRVRLRDRRVDLRRIDQHLLVVTAADDHIAPRAGTMPIFDLVCSDGRHPLRSPRRAHRPDGRLGRGQEDLARHRHLAGRALGRLRTHKRREPMSTTKLSPTARDRDLPR